MTAICQNRAIAFSEIKSVSSVFEPQNNMKKLQKISSLIRGVAVGLAVIGCIGTAKAVPFASGITNVTIGGSNYITFHINESGGSVSVVSTQPDGITNLRQRQLSCRIDKLLSSATNTSWQVYCRKTGNGVPIQITTDALATTNATTGATNWLIENIVADAARP